MPARDEKESSSSVRFDRKPERNALLSTIRVSLRKHEEMKASLDEIIACGNDQEI
jgi:hypothetical protein